MPKILAALGSKLSFAHLTGVGAARASDDDKSDDDKPKDAKASDDDDGKPDDDSGKGKGKAKSAKADDDNGDDKGDDDKSKDAKGKSAKADDDDPDAKADDDEDSDEEMRGKSAASSARRRERARCAAIFACRAAGGNAALAAHFAFNTTMTRSEAIAALEAAPAASAPNHATRQAANPRLSSAGPAQMSSGQSIAKGWDGVLSAHAPQPRR